MECESKHKEIQWTSSKLLEYFNVEKIQKIAQSTQLEATHMIFKKNDHTKHYFEDYTKLLNFDMNLITDKYNHINKHDAFKENRHDQSIFSLLTKNTWWRNYSKRNSFPRQQRIAVQLPLFSC